MTEALGLWLHSGGSINIDMTGKYSAFGGLGTTQFKFAESPWKTNPDQPTAIWVYDCPCGEQHRLATAVTSALRCAETGVELTEEARYRTEVKAHREVFPAMHGGTDAHNR